MNETIGRRRANASHATNTYHPNRAATSISAFSLVEVTVALAIVAFTLMSVVALLPLGLRANRESADETRASFLLTMIETDVRNACIRKKRSGFYDIKEVPYEQNQINQMLAQVNKSLHTGAKNAGIYYFDANERPIGSGPSAPPKAHFRVSLVYVHIPQQERIKSLAPVLATIVISWPAQLDPFDEEESKKLEGSVRSLVSFPAP